MELKRINCVYSAVIPQTCKFKGRKFECGLSISCILGGGKPMDLCSGGMIWSCCVDEEVHPASNPHQGAIKNASKSSQRVLIIFHRIQSSLIIMILSSISKPTVDSLYWCFSFRNNSSASSLNESCIVQWLQLLLVLLYSPNENNKWCCLCNFFRTGRFAKLLLSSKTRMCEYHVTFIVALQFRSWTFT